ncbi:hypothetical protein Patl1_07382 [Pistacia atlantica]|uniref:Uncharacterized protein n=1 Tax=Pistacia atlantica TaxID=434234 RepID=A0ACC1ADN0_9ROSI|nr:hypothetical protein Patl1_07382 [Pistacia atlantica]
MMNFVAICLVVTSLVAAGVFSPNPEKNNQKEQVIVKEGHRVVVVEYDEHGQTNTKVFISPENEYYIKKPGSGSASDVEEKISSAASDAYNNAKGKIKEASSDLSQELSGSKPSFGEGHGHGPAELLCDAYGNCKHKIASAIGKAKDKVKEAAIHGKEKANEAKEKASEVAHGTIAFEKEKATEAKDKVSEAAHDAIAQNKEIAHEAKAALQDAFGKAKEGFSEKAHGVKEAVQKTYGKAKEGTSQTAQDVKGTAEKPVAKAKGTIKETKDLGNAIRGDIGRNVSEQVASVRGSVKEKAKEAKEGTKHAAERVKTGAHNFFDRFVHRETFGGLMGVLNMLGFAIAYGMCVWVSFVSSYVLAEALPRQQFGMVQSKIYPVYFRGMACSIVLALLGHMPRLFAGGKVEIFQGFNLLASILMVFVNSMYMEPRATKVMFERMKAEKEEGRGRESILTDTSWATERERPRMTDPTATATTTTTGEAPTPVTESTGQEQVRSKISRLSERLKNLNTCSSILNILTLMSLSWHLVYLGQRLQKIC